jgi:hypothetical protein
MGMKELAAQWSKELGYEVKALPGFPAIWLGSFLFVAPGPGNEISVVYNLAFEFIQQDVQRADPSEGERQMAMLWLILNRVGRNFWVTDPARTGTLQELKSLTIKQTLRISKRDPSTFNRYADALIEVGRTGGEILDLIRSFGVIAPKPMGSAPPSADNLGARMYG